MIIEKIAEKVDFDLSESASIDFVHMMKRQFEIRQKESKSLRISGLGKPAVLQALSWLGHEQESVSFQSKMRFFDGDVFEAQIVALAKSIGINITDDQLEVRFEGVKGHVDGIFEGKLVEIKTANDNFFKAVQRTPLALEDRGYLTQAGCYCAGLGLEDYLFLLKNKNTGELFEVEGKPDRELVSRAGRVIHKIQGMKNAEDILAPESGIRAPVPVKEFYKKEETGKFLLPQAMAYSPYRSAFYDLRTGKNGYNKDTEYCVGVKELVKDEELKDAFNRNRD